MSIEWVPENIIYGKESTPPLSKKGKEHWVSTEGKCNNHENGEEAKMYNNKTIKQTKLKGVKEVFTSI